MSENGDKNKGLKIVRFQAENIKKLKVVEITPEGNVVVITGRNEAGKSSILDAIWLILGGDEAVKGTKTKRVIRDGADSASGMLDLGDIVVKKRWTANDKYYLTVETKEGARFHSPQSLLDTFRSRLSFDPGAFSNMEEAKQKQTLLDLVGLDLTRLDTNRKVVYDRRTNVNRKVDELKGQLAGIPSVPSDTPDEEVSASTVLKEREDAQRIIDANNEVRNELNQKRDEAIRLTDREEEISGQITDIETEIARLEKEREVWIAARVDNNNLLVKLKEEGVALKEKVAGLQDPDLTQFQSRIDELEATNKLVRDKAQRKAVEQNLIGQIKLASDMTAEINAIDKEKEEALKAAKFPVDGLGFDEAGITYRGIPFSQCSSEERLRVSLAMAMALNPKVRVLRVTDGSLLDSAHMKIITDMCEEKDFQVWCEVVKDEPGTGVFIEDGAIVASQLEGATTEEKAGDSPKKARAKKEVAT